MTYLAKRKAAMVTGGDRVKHFLPSTKKKSEIVFGLAVYSIALSTLRRGYSRTQCLSGTRVTR